MKAKLLIFLPFFYSYSSVLFAQNYNLTTTSKSSQSDESKKVFNVLLKEEDKNHYWKFLGPYNTRGASATNSCSGRNHAQDMGRIDIISAKPENSNELLAGSINGGIFKTKDGGKNWYSVTDRSGLSFVGISSMIRHPKNSNIIYASTKKVFGIYFHGGGVYCGDGRSSYGIGIIASFDNGENWEWIGANNIPAIDNQDSYRDFFNSQNLCIDPRSSVKKTRIAIGFKTRIDYWEGKATFESGSWKTIVQLDNWGATDPDNNWENSGIQQVEFASSNELWFATQEGLFSWDLSTNEKKSIWFPLPTDCNPDSLSYKNQTWKTNPVRIENKMLRTQKNEWVIISNLSYLYEKNNSIQGKKQQCFYYYAKNKNAIWTKPALIQGGSIIAGINPYNAKEFFFQKMLCASKGYYNPNQNSVTVTDMNNSQNHYDMRGFFTVFYKKENKIVTYVGTDGGVSKCEDGVNWIDITGDGLSCTNFYGLDVSDVNPDKIMCGAFDGNINYYNEGKWYLTMPGGDNCDAAFVTESEDSLYQTSQGSIHFTNCKSDTDCIVLRTAGPGGWIFFPVFTHKLFRKSEVFWGGSDLGYSPDFLVTKKTFSNKKIFNAHRIYAMDAAIHNKLIFATRGWYRFGDQEYNSKINEGGVYLLKRNSKDEWDSDSIFDISSNLRNHIPNGSTFTKPGLAAPIHDLIVHPKNPETIFICFGGLREKYKVWFTLNEGSEWKPYGTNGLPNLWINCIAYDEIKGILYAGTDRGIYYCENENGNWYYLGKNQPPATVTDMKISSKRELVVCYSGRGLWKTVLK